MYELYQSRKKNENVELNYFVEETMTFFDMTTNAKMLLVGNSPDKDRPRREAPEML
jgi:hypothetical protein